MDKAAKKQVIWGEVRLLWRHGLIAVAGLVYGLYGWIIPQVPIAQQGLIGALLVFSDPAMLGFLFIGTIILLDRQTGRLKALQITPGGLKAYLGRKTLALTLLALAGAILMVSKVDGYPENPGVFLLGFMYATLFFLALGIAGTTWVSSLNAYLMLIPIGFLPLLIPLLGYVGIHHPLLYLLPTHAMLLLLHPDAGIMEWGKLTYALLYPLPWLWGAWHWAINRFQAQ